MPKIHRKPIKELKKDFINSFSRNLGIISLACNECHITYNTYKKWLQEDPTFLDECRNVENMQIDYVENKLMELISEKNISAVIFFLKCRRGEKWNDKSNQINVNITNTEFQIGNSNEFKQLEGGVKIIDMNEEQD